MSIAIDLDGTLALYDGWEGSDKIGDPVPAMVDIMLHHIRNGEECVIFTARVSGDDKEEAEMAEYHIRNWLAKNDLPQLKITCIKEKAFRIFYDDRAIRIAHNEGKMI